MILTCIVGAVLLAIFFAICYALGLIADTMEGVSMDAQRKYE